MVNEICILQISTKDAPPPPAPRPHRLRVRKTFSAPRGCNTKRPAWPQETTNTQRRQGTGQLTELTRPPSTGEWRPRLPRLHNCGLVKQLRTETLKPAQKPQAPNSADSLSARKRPNTTGITAEGVCAPTAPAPPLPLAPLAAQPRLAAPGSSRGISRAGGWG